MALLIGRMRGFLADREQSIRSCDAPCDLDLLESKFGFQRRKKGETDIVLAEDMAVELGHPSTASQAIVLSSHQSGLVRHGHVSVVGPDVDEVETADRRPLGQVVMLALRQGQAPDPFEIDNTQYLTRRLPGYMVRSVPGRLWVRISRKAEEAGLTLKTVGSALIAAYTHDFDAVEGAEVVFVTSCGEDVEALAEIANEAKILAGKHKKLVLGADGEAECPDLACETCEEKPLCDELRDIVVKKRSRRQ
jgi:CO dehydrogenase/acetyl-CoA synthase beta subunit